jgi:hypothetical protein
MHSFNRISGMDNANPLVLSSAERAQHALALRTAEPSRAVAPEDEDLVEEIFSYSSISSFQFALLILVLKCSPHSDFLRSIRDPEHPRTLEELAVIYDGSVCIEHLPGRRLRIDVLFCPTVPHCSMATIIGLAIRVKLIKYFPEAKVLFPHLHCDLLLGILFISFCVSFSSIFVSRPGSTSPKKKVCLFHP